MKWSTRGINLIKSIGWQIVIPAPIDENIGNIDTDTEYTVEIKKKSKKRTLNANAFCWVLCQRIAEELSKNGYTSKEDVYRKSIKDCGHFTYVPVRVDAVDRYIQIWQCRGIGWIAEDVGECQSLHGYHNIMCYHGSSAYDTKEMARLIDCLVDECNQLGITLEPGEYIKSLVEEWANEQAKTRR